MEQAVNAMKAAISDRAIPAALRDSNDPWWRTMKASGEFLDLVFPDFYRRMGLYMDMRKADYHRLVAHIPLDLIDDEVKVALNAVVEVSNRANPVTE
jgi:hypothetical protein